MQANNFLKTIILTFAALILVIGLLEFATRAITESNTVLNINIGGFREYHPTRRAQLKKNYEAENISINSHGILGPEFEIERHPKKVRILTIGDSATFSPPGRNYSKVLDEKLKTFVPSNDVEIIVGAVPGYSSHEALDWYNEFLHKLTPDIAIIYLGWNDMGQFHPFGLRYKNESLSYQERTLIGSLMENLTFLRIPYFFIGRMERSTPVDTSQLTSEEREVLDKFIPTHYETNLKSLISKLKKQGSAVYLLHLAGLNTYPQTDEELSRMHFPRGMNKKLEIYKSVHDKYAKALEEASRSTGAPIIDLREIIRTPDQRHIFTDTMHINVAGAEQFGGFIAESIKTKVHEIHKKKIESGKSLVH